MLELNLTILLALVFASLSIGYQIGRYQAMASLRQFWLDYRKHKKAVVLEWRPDLDGNAPNASGEDDPNWNPAWGTKPQ